MTRPTELYCSDCKWSVQRYERLFGFFKVPTGDLRCTRYEVLDGPQRVERGEGREAKYARREGDGNCQPNALYWERKS